MTTPHSRIPYLPARIEGLSALAMNLWWSWSREARALFRSIDEALWHLTRHNPLELLCRVDPARIAACASDSDFLRRYDDVMARLAHGTTSKDTWFAQKYPELDGRPVAYFCAEFGLHNSVPIYSGGLGCSRRPLQGLERSRRPDGGHRSLLPQGLFRPAAPARRCSNSDEGVSTSA